MSDAWSPTGPRIPPQAGCSSLTVTPRIDSDDSRGTASMDERQIARALSLAAEVAEEERMLFGPHPPLTEPKQSTALAIPASNSRSSLFLGGEPTKENGVGHYQRGRDGKNVDGRDDGHREQDDDNVDQHDESDRERTGTKDALHALLFSTM